MCRKLFIKICVILHIDQMLGVGIISKLISNCQNSVSQQTNFKKIPRILDLKMFFLNLVCLLYVILIIHSIAEHARKCPVMNLLNNVVSVI